MTVVPSSSAMARGTMSRRLVLRTTALVALVAVLLSVLTALAAYQILVGQLDARLTAAASRGVAAENDRSGSPPGVSASGQQEGTLIYEDLGGGFVRAGVLTRRGATGISVAAVNQLAGLDAQQRAHTVTLDGLGPYRVMIFSRGQARTVVGLPLAEVTTALGNLLLASALLTLAAMAAAFFAAIRVVERSLRPLSRLAATATAVSNLELGRGEGSVPVRVADADADPVSEVGRVGQAFNHMLDNVEGALSARQRSETKVRQFVADASHELRNPLASIRGYAELTRRERDHVSPDMAHALSRIESESARMSSLVQDLLLLARLDSGPSLDLRPTDVTEVVLDAVADARAAGPKHVWLVSVPDEPVLARADPGRLHQVVANLLGNARTHTPAGTTVETAVRDEGGWAQITVTDHGPGIPADLRPRVFERFTKADASRARQRADAAGRDPGSSTGLGLSIVAAVVEAHHGTYDVSSRPGHTSFRVRIPAASAETDA